jgi:hypothetical protein
VAEIPHRRLRLTLDLEADNLGSLTVALENIARDLAIDGRETREVTSGGYSASYHLVLTCDPDMDGDRYREVLAAWSTARRRSRKEADRGTT